MKPDKLIWHFVSSLTVSPAIISCSSLRKYTCDSKNRVTKLLATLKIHVSKVGTQSRKYLWLWNIPCSTYDKLELGSIVLSIFIRIRSFLISVETFTFITCTIKYLHTIVNFSSWTIRHYRQHISDQISSKQVFGIWARNKDVFCVRYDKGRTNWNWTLSNQRTRFTKGQNRPCCRNLWFYDML